LRSEIPGLKDSKKLSAKRRQELVVAIKNDAEAIALYWVNPEEIDAIGLGEAMSLAMRGAFSQISKEVDDRVIVDGNINYLSEFPDTEALIKADDTVQAVMAASIIAKEARDQYMREQALQYPEFKFDSNVGYGTLDHRKALQAWGVTKIHRRSYKPIARYVQEVGEYSGTKSL
jgi:ribonuclease HII